MFIVVVGCGRVGYQLTKSLLATGHEVVVIEKDEGRCKALTDEVGTVAMRGDGTEVRVLKESGAARADVIVAVTDMDEDNLSVCQIAKHSFDTPKTMALVKDPQIDVLFKILGVDGIVNSTHLALSAIEDEIPGRALVHLMDLKDHRMEMISVNIPPDGVMVGKPLSEIELPPNSFISLVVKEDESVLPSDGVVIGSGDDIVVVTDPDKEQLLYETLTEVK